MKKLLTYLLVSVFVMSQNFAMSAFAAQTVKLMNNTRVKVSTMDNISSDLSTQGQEVSFQLAENVVVDNKVLIKAGTIVTGNITTLEPRSFLEKGGKLSVELLYTTAVDGSRVPLRGTYATNGTSKVGKMVALTLIITPLFLLMRGDHAVIPAGTKLNGYVDQDCLITLN